MPPNLLPIFPGTLRNVLSQVSVANTSRDGTGTLVTALTPGTNGSRVTKITVKATGTTTAGMIRFFLNDGVGIRLYDEIDVPAVTPSGTVKAWKFTKRFFGEDAIILPNGTSLQASTHIAETFNIIVEGGDY